jgi:hypothetical protein
MVPLVIMVFLFVWETTYTGKRPHPHFKTEEGGVVGSDGISGSDGITGTYKTPVAPMSPIKDKDEIKQIELVETNSLNRSETEDYGAGEKKFTFRQQLKVYRGRVTDRNWFKAFLQPFPLFLFPAVMFSNIVNGAFITWMMISGIISMQVLLYAPYNLQPDTLAYIGLPGSAVGLIASVSAGFLNDWGVKKLSKMNNGIYEPEFRLLAMIPATIFSTLGFVLLAPAYRDHYSVPKLVALGLLFHIGGPFASSACITYIFDTQGKSTTEAFVATSLLKSVFIAIATKKVPLWYKQVGPMKCFHTLAVLNICFASLTIPMYIFGKRLRGYVS